VIPVIDDYLSDLIESKFKYLRKNPSHIEDIITLSPNKMKSLQAYISRQEVEVIKGFPIKPNQLPCIAILLGNENEEQGGLGDYSEDEDADIRTHTETLTVIESVGGKLAVPYVQLEYKPVVAIQQVFSQAVGQVLPEGHYYIDNERQSLVGFLSGLVEAGDEVAVTYSYRHVSEVSLDTMFEHNFRIEVWSNNADIVSQLYALTKWAVLSGRDDLVTQCGLYRQRLSGADLQPDTNLSPEFAYRRGLNFWCQADSSVPIQEIGYVSDVVINETIGFDTKGGDEHG